MNTRVYQAKRGQTMLELIISIGVVSFVILGLVMVVTSSLRYAQSSRYRSGAVKFAQEGMELVRTQRDSSAWDDFQARAGSSPKIWCIDASGTWTLEGAAGCAPLDGLYTRRVSLQWTDPIVHAVVTISWQDGPTQFNSQLESYFTQWK